MLFLQAFLHDLTVQISLYIYNHTVLIDYDKLCSNFRAISSCASQQQQRSNAQAASTIICQSYEYVIFSANIQKTLIACVFVSNLNLIRKIFSFQGKATGNKPALVLRSNIQKQLFQLGCVIQKHAGKVLLFGVLILCILFGLGLNRGHIENRLEKLWVQGKNLPSCLIILMICNVLQVTNSY